MNHIEQWIWLPTKEYPSYQHTVYSGLLEKDLSSYTVAEFQKDYHFSSRIQRADLRFSGDAVFQFYCNDHFVATGPACVGGDFLENNRPRPNFYAFETTIFPNDTVIHFFARVQMMPIQICEYSKGHGGFMLSAILTFDDGSQKEIHTNEEWFVRRNGAYTGPGKFDGTIQPDTYTQAECIENIWNTETAPIPPREEFEIMSENGHILLQPGEMKTLILDFDRIWAGFISVKAYAQEIVSLQVHCREVEEHTNPEKLIFSSDGEYRGFLLHSAGNMLVHAQNPGQSPAKLTVSLIATHYPIREEAHTVTSDDGINLVLDTCKHTLKICRQTHHLDSPRHCEPLACTGDYYIESLMTPFSFGDMGLSEFDIIRTAILLETNDGRMFHTTYSLVWVRMLWDVYSFTGNKALLERCNNALMVLLSRFQTYLGDNGLLETPPDYMFVDWICLDGHSMHHPPKALGQSCLNMYYFAALDAAEKIYSALSLPREAKTCSTKKKLLKESINALLFDADLELYFEGLNSPTEDWLLGDCMPQNTNKRYYLKHANILAACFGVCDEETGKNLVHRIMSDEIQGDYQPYFAHYLLEAVNRLGLRESYTVKLIRRWVEPVRSCPKGLVEGFVKPESTYQFDHSHAWGGTPLYSLPKALLGLEILEPGMKKISLSPALLGLKHAYCELLTPHGRITCSMIEGQAPRIICPDKISLVLC